MKPKLPDNPDERFRELARSIAKDSIVTQATARLIEQVVQACHAHSAESIASLKEANEELVKALAPFAAEAAAQDDRNKHVDDNLPTVGKFTIAQCRARAAIKKARG
ncbi:hypothetical protein [Methylocystis sp. S23]